MYFWKVDKLVEDMREDRVTQKEELKYMLASAILTLLLMELSSFLTGLEGEISYGMTEFLMGIGFILLCAGGIYYCSRINEAGDGRNFLNRFVCLGWTTSIKFSVISLPIIVFIFVVAFFAIDMVGIASDEEATSVLDVSILFVLVAYYFLYFGYLGKNT